MAVNTQSPWAFPFNTVPDVEFQTEGNALESKEIFFETFDGTIYHGWYCEDDTEDYPKYFIANLYAEIIPISEVKRWMYMPA